MTFSSTVIADLHALSLTFDDPDVDIAQTLAQLSEATAAGVESYRGLSMTVTGSGIPWHLSTFDHSEVIGSSILIPLAVAATTTAPAAVVALVLYAETPGAFVDVAADLAWMTGKDLSEFRVDQHLTAAGAASNSVQTLSIINQAVGVLIGRGRTPEQATQDLASSAERGDGDLRTAAAAVLSSLHDPAPGASRASPR